MASLYLIKAEIWNIHSVLAECGHGTLAFDDVKVGVQVISEHEKVSII